MDSSQAADLLVAFLVRLEGRRVLLVDPPASRAAEIVDRLGARYHGLAVHCRDRRAYRACRGRLPSATAAGAWVEPCPGVDTVIAFLPRGREVQDLTFGNLADLVHESSHSGAAAPRRLYVVGHKREGIKSAPTHARRWFPAAEVVASGSHSSVISIDPGAGRPCHLEDWEKRWILEDTGEDEAPLTLLSYPGVFSHGRTDPATRLLLDAIDVPEGSSILDVGSGCGVIGAALAVGHPGARVQMIDSSELAVVASRRTLEANGLERVRCAPSDLYDELPGEAGYDVIVTNPPFHSGASTDYKTTTRLIAEAPARLAPGGRLWLVANRFLPYPDILRRAFGRVVVAAETARYRVYAASS